MSRLSIFVVCLLLLLSPNIVKAAVLFEDDFDAWPAYSFYSEAGNNPPSPWTIGLSGTKDEVWDLCILPPYSMAAEDLPPYNGGMAVASGADCVGGTGKCFEMPRHECIPNGYWGSAVYNYETQLGEQSDLYVRWYMKFDILMNKTHPNGFKTIDRFGFKTTLGNERPLLVGHYTGTNLITDDMWLLNSVAGDFAPAQRVYDYEDFWDGEWHSFEIRMKLNSDELTSDGRVTTWVDGVQIYDYNNVLVVDVAGTPFYKYINFGLGNVSDELWSHSGWQSMWLDEFVVSTTYIGPIAGGSSGSGLIGPGSGNIAPGSGNFQ